MRRLKVVNMNHGLFEYCVSGALAACESALDIV